MTASKTKVKVTKALPRAAVSVATLHIAGAQKMSHARKMDVAKWLVRQACDLVEEGDNYAARFKAIYRLP